MADRSRDEDDENVDRWVGEDDDERDKRDEFTDDELDAVYFEPVEDLDLAPTVVRWVVDGVIPQGVTIIYGKPSAGKSFVVLDIAAAVATGRSWLDKYEVRKGHVFYISAEAEESDYGDLNRVIAVRKKFTKEERGILGKNLHIKSGPISLMNRRSLKALVYALEKDKLRPSLFIIDTLAASITGADENSSASMGTMLQNARWLRSKYPYASMIIVHHPSRDGNEPRGHSNLDGSATAILRLKRLRRLDAENPEAEKEVPLVLESVKPPRNGAPFGRIYLERVEIDLVESPEEEKQLLEAENKERQTAGLRPYSALPTITTQIIRAGSPPKNNQSGTDDDERATSKNTTRDENAYKALDAFAADGAPDAKWRASARERDVKGGSFDRAKIALVGVDKVRKVGDHFITTRWVAPDANAA